MAKEVAGGGGGLFEGGDYLNISVKGTAIIRENEVKRFSLSLDL